MVTLQGFHRHGCGLQQRRPIWVEDAIRKEHTADTGYGHLLSFVYHACSVHNRVSLVGEGSAVSSKIDADIAKCYPPDYHHQHRPGNSYRVAAHGVPVEICRTLG